MKHGRISARYRLIIICCMTIDAGCGTMRLLGDIAGGVLTKTPRQERSVGHVEHAEIPGPAGRIGARIYTPEGPGPFPAAVYFHGGGWSGGSPATHDDLCRFLCSRTPCVVISVDYRLAPKDKFPAAFDDAYAATLWAFNNSAALNAAPGRLALAGDSAGGNLAAAVALALRDRGGPKPLLQVLAFPATELARLDSDSYRRNDAEANLKREDVVRLRDQYLRGPEDRLSPYASPLLAPDHRGLPPALIIVGELDVVRDDGLRYGAKLAASGVPVRTVELPGQAHAAVAWALASEQVRAALDATVQALQGAFWRKP